MNKYLLSVSGISTVLAVITRYIFGKDASGDILMWLLALALLSLIAAAWNDEE
jgi:hypothetical protein